VGAKEELCKYLLRFNGSITAGQLCIELQNLGNQWHTLEQSIADAHVLQEDSGNELEHSTNPLSITVVPNPFCAMDPFDDLAASYGPL